MIYTVTFNPSLDYVISVNEFETGKMNRIQSEVLFPGGKGINVSIVLAELGVENTALGFVAGFTGEELKQNLKDRGILTDFIPVENGFTRINIKMRTQNLMDAEADLYLKQETEINGQGPVVSEDDLSKLLEKIKAMVAEDVLIVSGSVSKGVPQNIYADIVKLCNEKNVRVIVDASSALLWNALEYHPFLIKPNHHELGDIFNRDIQSYEEVVFYAKELQNRGARNVLVSMGKDGAVLVAEDGQIYESKAPEGQVLNSVGAGDSMVAGFIADYLVTNDYDKALKLGICAGSATAFSEGLADKEKIQEILAQI